MTTTSTFQGMDSGAKPSSRVLNPPGGGSSNIFGVEPQWKPQEPGASAKSKSDNDIPNQQASQDSQPASRNRNPKIGESSFHTLFGWNSSEGVKEERGATPGRKGRCDYNQTFNNVFGDPHAKPPEAAEYKHEDTTFFNVIGSESFINHNELQKPSSLGKLSPEKKPAADSDRSLYCSRGEGDHNSSFSRVFGFVEPEVKTPSKIRGAASINPITGEPLHPPSPPKTKESPSGEDDEAKKAEDQSVEKSDTGAGGDQPAQAPAKGSQKPSDTAASLMSGGSGGSAQEHSSTRVSQPPGGRSTKLW